ncbi:MAG: response regulator [bacterium]
MSNVRKRILVADDTLPMRIMLQDVLSEAGFDVVTASDGEEAWSTICDDAEGFDLYIIDLLMPKVTGFEILERLEPYKDPVNKKVLVVTGIFKSQKEINRLKELGALGYITKTALVDEILFRVNQVFYYGHENTRKYPRLLKSLPVDYQAGENTVSSYTSNLSLGGAFIRTINPMPEGEEIDLSFRIPDINLSVEATARVAWTNEYETYRKKSCLPGMGVEFVNIDSEILDSMDYFIQDQLEKEPVWLVQM